MSKNTRHETTIRRAALPELIFSPDAALALGITEEEADAAMIAGRFGPHFEVRGRPAVLRRDLLAAITKRAGASREKEVLP